MKALDDGLSTLTDAQRQAAEHIEGPLLVLAGPGSGKTRVIVHRIAHLISQGIPAWSILGLTFTNKAAGEMRSRIDALLPEDLPGRRGLTLATFHSFCSRVLRRNAEAVGLSPRFSIYDSADQREMIKRALEEVGLDSKNWPPAQVGASISSAKNRLVDVQAYAAGAHDFHSKNVARIYAAYQRLLRAADAADFDDLLLLSAKLLKDNESARRQLQERFQYLLIDEYQDTNHAQFVIAHALAAAHRNICVVGDPDQSIYGWRGADIRNILEFEKQYPETAIIPLGENFRSTGHIVAAAAALIQRNKARKHKDLTTSLGPGEKVEVVECRDEHHEARRALEAMRAHHEAGLPWREMAVLYRINALSRVMEETLRDAQVPYVIARGTAFYDRKEIRDALAYLRVIANPNDEVSLRRIINTPARGISGATLNALEVHAINGQITLAEALEGASEAPGLSSRAAAAVGKFVAMLEGWRSAAPSPTGAGANLGEGAGGLAELVERVIRESGLEDALKKSKSDEDEERLLNLEELVSAAAEFVPPTDDDEASEGAGGGGSTLDLLQRYLESVALVSDADAIDPASGAVTLMTLHAAKGLEFDVIVMIGLEEGLLPHSRATASESELEEERRLCFVGMTRARKHLLMSRATERTQRGLRERTMASQFLRELPEDAVARLDETGGDADSWSEDDGGGRGWEWGRSMSDRRSAGRSVAAAEGAGTQHDEFPVGCLVRHPSFGLGRVESLMRQRTGTRASVAFTTSGRKTLILEYAKLVRVDS